MLTAGGPKLVEYNARFGDPETQVLMPRLKSDLLDLLYAAATGSLRNLRAEWLNDVALTVVMATNGYPGAYARGSQIKGVAGVENERLVVFHAGTKRQGYALTANGGRVLNVTALGPTVRAAQRDAYAAIDRIDWPDGFCRRDIGWRAIQREWA